MSDGSSRRQFLKWTSFLGCVAPLFSENVLGGSATRPARKMRLCLSPGAIGVKAGPRDTLALASKFGFEAIEPSAEFLAGLSDSELTAFLAEMKSHGLTFGAAGLPINFRGDDAQFQNGLQGLAKRAAALQRAGVDRVGTWISPGHNTLTYLENFKRHAARLRESAKVLRDHGQRLGLEYVGTPTSRQRQRYPFIHSLREMQELISDIGAGNVGFVLDSWHWWTAGEGEAELLALKPVEIISVDLNDAPGGIPVDQQLDGKRELPCATGVIPMGLFLNALQQIGYDGPVRAEPFNKPLNDLSDEEACDAVSAALRKAMALLK